MTIQIKTEMNEYPSRIKEEAESLFKIMTFHPNKIEVVSMDDIYLIKVDMNNPKTLIGERGQTLLEIQYILRLVIRKKIQSDIFIELDINDYKKKKKEILTEIAQDVGDEVAFYKKEKVLPPMNPYERRTIHLALKGREGIETESIGEGPDRKIVIRPIL